MKSRLVIAVLCLLLGGIMGSMVAHQYAQRHPHARAVMWLAQVHLDRMSAAARAGQCQDFESERLRLGVVQEELRLAFPLAYRQEADFRKQADAFAAAVRDARAPSNACNGAEALTKPIQDACKACHRDYR